MKLLLLLFCLAAAKADVLQRCAGPVINGIRYADEVLKSGLESPLYLNYDKPTNALYYTHYFSSRDAYKLDLSTKESTHLIYGVYGVFAITVDAKTSDIFIGANDGIYKYNKDKNDAEFYGARGNEIWQLFSKNNVVYFNTFNFTYDESNINKVINGEVSKLEDLKDVAVRIFIIDNDGYIVYSNSTGVFRQKLGTEDAVLYATDKFIRGFTIDTRGDVYAAVSDGIYFVNKQNHTLDQYFAVIDCYGVAFDSKNNIFYADEKTIHLLKPKELPECV